MANVWNMLGLALVAFSCIVLQVPAVIINSCGDNHSKIQLQKLIVTPKELKVPGNITVSGSVKLLSNITGPVQVIVTFRKKTLIGYIPMPLCINNIGSCTYQDACSLSPYAHSKTCPEESNKLDLPCKCPLKKGVLEVHKFTHSLDANTVPSFLVSGTYKINIKMSSQEGDLGCFDAQLTLH